MNKPRLLVPFIVASVVIAACAQPTATPGLAPVAAPQPATTGALAPAARVKVRLATWTGVEEAKELQAVIDNINAAATMYVLVHEPQPADYYAKIQTNLAGGAADLLWLSQENITGYAGKGVLLDIGDNLKNDAGSAAKLDDYFADVLQTAQFNGKAYRLPWIAEPVVLYAASPYYSFTSDNTFQPPK